MRSRKTATVLLACIVAQVCLLVMLVTMPVYALEGGYCTNCIGGCFTYGCDFSGCWLGPCHCQCMCCVDDECVWDSVYECEPRPN
jgi:hypothetical protein